MNTINTYTINELKAQFPDGFDKALQQYRNNNDEVFWMDDIVASLKKVFAVAGIRLNNWSLGDQNSYVKFDWYSNESEFEGRKAYKWLKDTFDLKSYKRVNYKDHEGHGKVRYDFTKLDGKDWSCEFTGYCADDDFLESLFIDVHDGCNLEDSFRNLADTCQRLISNEVEYQNSEEYFIEHCQANDWEFLEDGRLV